MTANFGGYIPCRRLCVNLAHCNYSSISLYQVVDSFQVSLSHLWKVCVHEQHHQLAAYSKLTTDHSMYGVLSEMAET